MDVLRIRWARRLASWSDKFDRVLGRLGWRRPRDEQDGPPRQLGPDPTLFWQVVGSMSTASNEGMLIPVARLMPELRQWYPELQGPYAWRAAFQRWTAEETNSWRRGVLDLIFTQLWNRSAFHEVAPAIEEPSLADLLRAEESEHLTQGQDGLPVEMEIDQYW